MKSASPAAPALAFVHGRRPTRMMKMRQRGADIMNGILYMIIAGVVLAGVLGLFRDALFGSRTNDAFAELNLVQSKVAEAFYGAGSVYTGVSNADLANSGLLPSSMVSGSGATATLRNKFGGAINVAAGTGNQFTIEFTNLPKDSCVRLVQRTAPGVYAAVARSGTGGTSVTLTTAPPTLAQANSICNAGTVAVTWTTQ